MELLGSLENIAKAKSEILEDFTKDNWAVLNADDPRVSVMRTGASVRTYGIDHDCDVRARDITTIGLVTCFTYESKITGAKQKVALPMLGRHNVMNALASITMAELYGVPDTAIAESLQNIKMTGNGRNSCALAIRPSSMMPITPVPLPWPWLLKRFKKW